MSSNLVYTFTHHTGTEEIRKTSREFARKSEFLEIKASNECTKEEWLKKSCDVIVGKYGL